MKLRYTLLSAALITAPAFAGDFQSLGTLSANAMQDQQLARIEGGNPCAFSVFSACDTIQKIYQSANTNQTNVAAYTFFTKQSNEALTGQQASNSIR